MGKQSQSSEAIWRDRLARSRGSDVPVTQFCREEGVSVASFYHWRKRLGDQQKTKRSRRSGNRPVMPRKSQPFVPVHVPASVIAEVEFPNGVRVRVPATNVEALRAAILAGSEVCQEAR